MPLTRRSLPCTTILYERLIDVVYFLVLAFYTVYKWIAICVLLLIFPLTRRIIEWRMKTWFGLVVDGPGPCDPHFKTKTVLCKIAVEGALPLIEGVAINGEVEVESFKGLAEKVMESGHWNKLLHPLAWTLTTFNLQTRGRAWEVGKHHYDNAALVIHDMLDVNRQYSCGYWRNANTLDEAQLAKMELIGKKLHLKPGMRVLDIGCGYGTLAKYLASTYNVSVVGITISEEQIKYAREICAGISCEFRLVDYRDVRGETFDRIVTVGMFEHVGPKNHVEFLDICRRNLTDDGLLLTHFIGTTEWEMRRDWVTNKYIFRNSELPHFTEVAQAIHKSKWVMEDWHNFGADYTKTLNAWEKKFDADWSKKEPTSGTGMNVKDPLREDRWMSEEEAFYRVWKLYLQLSAVFFASRKLQLWQIVMSKTGVKGGYQAPR